MNEDVSYSREQCIDIAEQENFDKRLEDAKHAYRKKHGNFPPTKWEDYHRTRFWAWRSHLAFKGNIVNRSSAQVWKEFASSYKHRPPKPTNWDREFSEMESPF